MFAASQKTKPRSVEINEMDSGETSTGIIADLWPATCHVVVVVVAVLWLAALPMQLGPQTTLPGPADRTNADEQRDGAGKIFKQSGLRCTLFSGTASLYSWPVSLAADQGRHWLLLANRARRPTEGGG